MFRGLAFYEKSFYNLRNSIARRVSWDRVLFRTEQTFGLSELKKSLLLFRGARF